MRTTLTLEEDVYHRLKTEVRRSGRSFKEVVNDLLRRAFARGGKKKVEPFVMKTYRMGLRPGLSLDDVEGLLDRVEGPLRR